MKQEEIHLIINSLGRGGAERVCTTIANELVKKNKITIVALRNVNSNYINDLDQRINYICLNAPKDIIGLFYLKKYLKKTNINKIIAFDERITAICNYINKKSKKYKVISRVINNIDLREKNERNIIYKNMFKFSKKYVKYSDVVIFQCNAMKERMKRYFNLENNCYVIYNPLSSKFDRVNVHEKKADYFLMVGKLNDQKGYDYIINAMKKIVKINSSIIIKILGDGPKRKELENLISEYKLENNILLLGNVSNVENYYKEAKALILTSIYEGFPNVLLEANACGCPVISFDCPTGPKEIITKNNGILIKYLDIKELIKTILDFDSNTWDYDLIKKTTEKYKSEKIIKEYIKVIEEA